LPRDGNERRQRVLDEWVRVIRPGGLIFCAMHNPNGATATPYFENLGWQRIDALRGERTRTTDKPMFQEYLSSG
jgi:ubiquinone/menaquinone biosynthesis C-methylase UbiE